MRISLQMMIIAAAGSVLMTATAQAGSQSSNTSSNSSSNNGVVRDRVIETYCEDGYCERRVSRRTYREGMRYRKASRNNDEHRRYEDRRDTSRYSRDDHNDDVDRY